MPNGSRRRHRQRSQHDRHERTERLLDYGGWSLSLPNLWKCLDAGGLRHAIGRIARRNHQGENSLQQPARLNGILILLNSGAFATDALSYNEPVRADVRRCCPMASTNLALFDTP